MEEKEQLDNEIKYTKDLILSLRRQLRGNKDKLSRLLDKRYGGSRDFRPMKVGRMVF